MSITPTKPPKIIFFDIDDTLYIKHENRLGDNTQLALTLLKQNGIIPAIATGRGICIFPPCVSQMIDEVGMDTFVTINGQYNEHGGQMLAHFPLSLAQIRHTTDYLIRHNISYGYMTRDEIIGFNETLPMTHALTSLHIPYRVADSFDDDKAVYQMLAFCENNKEVNFDLPDDLKTVRWHISGVDILDSHGSKARGIMAVLDKLGLTMTDAWAFGDGLNDIEMLSSVGFGVAMGNAHDDLKAVADCICPRHDDDGIYRGLRELGVI